MCRYYPTYQHTPFAKWLDDLHPPRQLSAPAALAPMRLANSSKGPNTQGAVTKNTHRPFAPIMGRCTSTVSCAGAMHPGLPTVRTLHLVLHRRHDIQPYARPWLGAWRKLQSAFAGRSSRPKSSYCRSQWSGRISTALCSLSALSHEV